MGEALELLDAAGAGDGQPRHQRRRGPFVPHAAPAPSFRQMKASGDEKRAAQTAQRTGPPRPRQWDQAMREEEEGAASICLCGAGAGAGRRCFWATEGGSEILEPRGRGAGSTVASPVPCRMSGAAAMGDGDGRPGIRGVGSSNLHCTRRPRRGRKEGRPGSGSGCMYMYGRYGTFRGLATARVRRRGRSARWWLVVVVCRVRGQRPVAGEREREKAYVD